MSSSQRRNTWSLRARLLAGQIVLLAAACIGIGAVTELALYQYLVDRLDEQVHDSALRSARLFDRPPGSWHRHPPRPGPGPDFLDAPGQPGGIVAGVVGDGGAVDAGHLTTGGTREPLSQDAAAQLATTAIGAGPVTRDLDGIGRYRVVAVPARRSGVTIIAGLPLAGVEAILIRVLIVFGVVTVFAVAVGTAAGIVIIRRALAPLRRVAQTAGEVVDLPLDRGEVALPVRVPESDANPRTEVGQLGSAVNRMLDHIAAALSARQASETRVRQFVADASHELRTPLTAIRGYTELAQHARVAGEPDQAGSVAQALSRVQSETERMTRLVEDLLLLARLDSGRPLERKPVDLSHLLIDAVNDAHVAGPEQQWRLDLPEEPVTVVGDEARLHQVLTNLLTNARIHTGPGTAVTAKLSTDTAHAVLAVVDNGPGIPEPLQSEVFERFARGDTSRSRKGGSTGLGLAIASAVVHAHHGTLTVQSAPGHTQFTVRLPRLVRPNVVNSCR